VHKSRDVRSPKPNHKTQMPHDAKQLLCAAVLRSSLCCRAGGQALLKGLQNGVQVTGTPWGINYRVFWRGRLSPEAAVVMEKKKASPEKRTANVLQVATACCREPPTAAGAGAWCRPWPPTRVLAEVLWPGHAPCRGSEPHGPGEHHLPPGWGDGRGAGVGLATGIKQQWQASACLSKGLSAADKKAIHLLFPAEPCGRGEAVNRPVNGPSWRAARGGCPASFHRTSRCRQSPAGSLKRGSRCPAMAAILLPALRPTPRLPVEPPSPRLCRTSCLLTGENHLGSRTGNWICTCRRDEKLMFCGKPPPSVRSPLQAQRNEYKKNRLKAGTPH